MLALNCFNILSNSQSLSHNTGLVHILETPCCQHPASDFAASKGTCMEGVGLCFDTPWFQVPAVVSGIFEKSLEDGKDDVWEAALEKTVLVTYDCTIVHETDRKSDSLSVQKSHLDVLGGHLPKANFASTTKVKKSLQEYSCSVGVSTERSCGDAYLLSDRGRPAGICEVKHSTDSPQESLTQAFAGATNIGIFQIQSGVPVRSVCIPCVSSNGRLMQFGAVYFLEPCFPCCIATSKVLDLCDQEDRRVAAKTWARIQVHLGEVDNQFVDVSPPINEFRVGLNVDMYWVKPFGTFFKVEPTLHQSLRHYCAVMKTLYESGAARDYVLFPLTFRTGNDAHDGIVFDHLGGADPPYAIGVPRDKRARDAYAKGVKAATEAIHNAGIVHMDFYPSNIMWRFDEGEDRMDVKLIDWDAAHRWGSDLTTVVRSRTDTMDRTFLIPESERSKATLEWDLCLLNMLLDNINDASLCVATKFELDQAFKRLVEIEVLKSNVKNSTERVAALDLQGGLM